MIKILHLSDIHMGSGFTHGKINPATGLNTRLEDFVASLRCCINQAIALPVDLVLFGGDAFPDATPPPYIQEAFASQFRRLADANIPTILLVGNHDQHSQGNGGASLSIYRTLLVPGFMVGDKIQTHRITTGKGDIQVITLPWLTPSTLFTRPETEGLSLDEVNNLLIQRLQVVLEAEVRKLDSAIPTVLLGHLMADHASLGSERLLAVGKGFTLPVSLLTRPEIDYVALGHVHKHQNLNKSNNPPVVYAGSIERVDFSEEKEDKGYVLVALEKGNVSWEFCPLPVRPFCTIEVDASGVEDPEKAILKAIKRKNIHDAVVRLIYKIRSDQQELVKISRLQEALQVSHNCTISQELVSQLTRPRLPELGVGTTIEPLAALKTYLENRPDLTELKEDLLTAAEKLLAGNSEWSEFPSESVREGKQLSLL